MRRSTDRILTTHVGSLIRPPEIVTSEGSASTLRTNLREPAVEAIAMAVGDIVRRQIAVGLDVINDGEFGKPSWATYILDRLTGFEVRPDRPKPPDWLGRDLERFRELITAEMPYATDGMPAEVCHGSIAYRGHAALRRSIEQLRAAARAQDADRELFMTAVAPGSTAYNGINEYYPSDRDYIFAIAAALREEYRAIHEAGLILQVDDAVLANMYDHLVQQSPARYREWAELRIEALNYALAGIPAEHVRYHVCFGSWHGPHTADAPLAELADLILQVNAQAYSIEAANPRHEHEWRVWQDVRLPAGKILIPGVVTHHTTTVEHPRVVADRIVRFARIVGRENVIAGTDCGFAQADFMQRVHPSVMWAKLEALVAGARLASDELWR